MLGNLDKTFASCDVFGQGAELGRTPQGCGYATDVPSIRTVGSIGVYSVAVRGAGPSPTWSDDEAAAPGAASSEAARWDTAAGWLRNKHHGGETRCVGALARDEMELLVSAPPLGGARRGGQQRHDLRGDRQMRWLGMESTKGQQVRFGGSCTARRALGVRRARRSRYFGAAAIEGWRRCGTRDCEHLSCPSLCLGLGRLKVQSNPPRNGAACCDRGESKRM